MNLKEYMEQNKEKVDCKQATKSKNLRYKRDKHREKVKGKFKFHEVPGGQMSLIFREFRGDPVEKYTFKDEGIYSIPLGLAKHLNKNCWYPVHQNQVDEDGTPVQYIGQKVNRCSFVSLEFMDVEDEE